MKRSIHDRAIFPCAFVAAFVWSLGLEGCYHAGDTGTDGGSDSDSDNDSDVDGDADSDADSDSQGDDDDDNDDDSGSQCANEDLGDIFALTIDKDLFRFNPIDKSFKPVGRVNCQTGSSDDLAFSMTVSRDVNGYAYVLFVDRNLLNCRGIYKISTDDAACIEKTKFHCGDSGFNFFGMAFSTNSPTTEEESLFLAAGSPRGTGSSTLGRLNLETGFVESIGNMDLSLPDLTGNSNGELWGLFYTGQPPVISQIDKKTAKRGMNFEVTDIPTITYAFTGAYWGGSFYLFHMQDRDSTSKVYKVDRQTGAMKLFVSTTDIKVIGAGVSTCAPIDAP